MKLRQLTLLFSFALLIAGLSSCNSKQQAKNQTSGVEYYRNLLFSETPFDLERGSHKISAEQAQDINCYKFTSDESGRLLSVEYIRGSELLGYSSMGEAAKIIYDYADNKQVKHFFDKNNQPIESEGVFTEEYALNDKGVRTALRFLNKAGEPVENRNKIHNYVWAILDDGMVQEKRFTLEGKETILNPFCPFYELRFSYDTSGYVVRMANYMNDTLYNCTAENCGDIGVSYFTFTPNGNGDLEEFAVFNVTGQMSNLYWGWSKRVNKYDENGYLLETAVFDQDNEYLSGKNVPVTQNSYDKHGALIESKNLDKDRNLINSPENGVAITRYNYDEKGNRTETLHFNKDNVAVKI
jgi:YD repeat-containing protein